MIGIIVINKDKGWTSNDVVIKVKRMTGQKRVGHLGTLDPMATGVLPVCIGKATRLFDRYLKKKKTYIAEFKFGVLTDTLDSEGKILQQNGKIPDEASILRALEGFRGKIMQIPPDYSAKSVNGVRAYKLAREGKNVELAPREVKIFNFVLLRQVDSETFEFEIECSAGTYIRSLARDLGATLETCAIMTALNRTKCGEFELENAVTLEELAKQSIGEYIILPQFALKELPQVLIEEVEFKKMMSGVRVAKSGSGECLVMFEGKLVGIGEITNDGLLRLTTNLYED